MNLKKAQAAVELAIFGAILIFLLGAIVRSAAGNSYTQDQNLKAMRMAMLASWNGSKAGSTSHNSASVLFIEDRLSPDISKYGDMDRNPYIANGSGTFTYQLLYPLDVGEVANNLPIMDVYINGEHFPFTTAAYFSNILLTPGSCSGGTSQPYAAAEQACVNQCGPISSPETSAQQQCLQSCASAAQAQCKTNQILRNCREWSQKTVTEGQLANLNFETSTNQSIPSLATIENYAVQIFCQLNAAQAIKAPQCDGGALPAFNAASSGTITPTGASTLPAQFTSWFTNQFYPTICTSSNLICLGQAQALLNNIQNILQSNKTTYKLFYSMVANGEDQFSPNPPVCPNQNSLSCKDKALSSTLTVTDASGNSYTNANGDMQYDLLRLGNYAAVDAQFPTTASCPSASSLRCNIAWQWSATAATSASQIGLDTSSNTNYPSYDIDGRLKPVTIYTFSYDSTSGFPTVSYEDFQAGDIDETWDINSCSPKPGLQNDSQIYTFTQSGNEQNGTYLQIKEGQLYNPETGQFVRSANKKDTVDLIQREIQLSNNTGRFCNGAAPLSCVGNDCADYPTNPVEVCIPPGSGDNCFSSEQNIKSTCFDESDYMLYVRSRLEDRRGNYWLTNANGQLQVQ